MKASCQNANVATLGLQARILTCSHSCGKCSVSDARRPQHKIFESEALIPQVTLFPVLTANESKTIINRGGTEQEGGAVNSCELRRNAILGSKSALGTLCERAFPQGLRVGAAVLAPASHISGHCEPARVMAVARCRELLELDITRRPSLAALPVPPTNSEPIRPETA